MRTIRFLYGTVATESSPQTRQRCRANDGAEDAEDAEDDEDAEEAADDDLLELLVARERPFIAAIEADSRSHSAKQGRSKTELYLLHRNKE